MPASFILIFIVIVALMVIGGVFSRRQQKERQLALTQVAYELGLQFDPSRRYEYEDRFDQFGIFSTGHSHYAYNTLHGTLAIADQSETSGQS